MITITATVEKAAADLSLTSGPAGHLPAIHKRRNLRQLMILGPRGSRQLCLVLPRLRAGTQEDFPLQFRGNAAGNDLRQCGVMIAKVARRGSKEP